MTSLVDELAQETVRITVHCNLHRRRGTHLLHNMLCALFPAKTTFAACLTILRREFSL